MFSAFNQSLLRSCKTQWDIKQEMDYQADCQEASKSQRGHRTGALLPLPFPRLETKGQESWLWNTWVWVGPSPGFSTWVLSSGWSRAGLPPPDIQHAWSNRLPQPPSDIAFSPSCCPRICRAGGKGQLPGSEAGLQKESGSPLAWLTSS